MKILVFEGGEPGRMEVIPGENVQGELEELLGGEVVFERLSSKLRLVIRKDGHKEALQVRYEKYRPGQLPALIFGPAAVVRMGQDEKTHDITREDAEDVNLWIQRVEG